MAYPPSDDSMTTVKASPTGGFGEIDPQLPIPLLVGGRGAYAVRRLDPDRCSGRGGAPEHVVWNRFVARTVDLVGSELDLLGLDNPDVPELGPVPAGGFDDDLDLVILCKRCRGSY